MIKAAMRGGFALVVLLLLGLFGYFYATGSGARGSAERARGAAAQVGGVVVDEGVAGLVKVRLAADFGYDNTRFLHVWHEGGRVLVYGLAPATLDTQQVRADVEKIPGVSSADVLVQPMPAYVAAGAPAPAAQRSP